MLYENCLVCFTYAQDVSQVSLLLPAAVPMLTLLMMAAEMLALWLLPDVPDTPVVPAVPAVPDVLDGVDGLDADVLDGLS